MTSMRMTNRRFTRLANERVRDRPSFRDVNENRSHVNRGQMHAWTGSQFDCGGYGNPKQSIITRKVGESQVDDTFQFTFLRHAKLAVIHR